MAEFKNIFARYIKFNIIFITTFDNIHDEYLSTILPSLKSITISYNEIKKAYLYLNPEIISEAAPYQVSLAVNATDVDPDQIKVGVAVSGGKDSLSVLNILNMLKEKTAMPLSQKLLIEKFSLLKPLPNFFFEIS